MDKYRYLVYTNKMSDIVAQLWLNNASKIIMRTYDQHECRVKQEIAYMYDRYLIFYQIIFTLRVHPDYALSYAHIMITCGRWCARVDLEPKLFQIRFFACVCVCVCVCVWGGGGGIWTMIIVFRYFVHTHTPPLFRSGDRPLCATPATTTTTGLKSWIRPWCAALVLVCHHDDVDTFSA